MKRSQFLLAVVTAISFLGATSAFARPETPRLDAREQRFDGRIHRGVRTGDLTHREGARLRWDSHRLDRQERRFKSDGTLSFRERRALNRHANRLSRHIYHSRHDHSRHNHVWRHHRCF